VLADAAMGDHDSHRLGAEIKHATPEVRITMIDPMPELEDGLDSPLASEVRGGLSRSGFQVRCALQMRAKRWHSPNDGSREGCQRFASTRSSVRVGTEPRHSLAVLTSGFIFHPKSDCHDP